MSNLSYDSVSQFFKCLVKHFLLISDGMYPNLSDCNNDFIYLCKYVVFTGLI